jgi:hypothetical protein
MAEPEQRNGRTAAIGEFPWYPMLLVTALVLDFYVSNAVSVQAVFRPWLVFLLVALALVALIGTLARSVHVGGILALLLLCFLLPGDVVTQVTIIAAAWGTAFVIAIAAPRMRMRSPATRATVALNVVGTLLLGVVTANAVAAGKIHEIAGELDGGAPPGAAGALGNVDQKARMGDDPDIYLIMLDGYPRADTLERLFHFDNRAFLSALDDRGLHVSVGSRSNYMYTKLTLASVLHMRPVQDIDAVNGEASLRTVINHNPVFDILRERGYIVAATSAGWETEAMRGADIFCAGEQLNDFELNLVARSMAGRLLDLAFPGLVSERDRNGIRRSLECIHEVAALDLDRPKMLFAHVPAPHLPIVFARDGTPADPRFYGHTVQELPVTHAEFEEAYTDGLQFLNDQVLDAIDEIQRRSATPPVIVVFSDHGSESRLNWDNAPLSDLDERFANLFAAATPGAPGLYRDDPTPVNLFPVLLNEYLGADVPLAPDGLFVSPVQDRLDLTPAPRDAAAVEDR